MTTRYAIRVGDTLYPPGTQVRLATIDEMRQEWPGISRNDQSLSVGVWFPGNEHPTIVHTSQVFENSGIPRT